MPSRSLSLLMLVGSFECAGVRLLRRRLLMHRLVGPGLLPSHLSLYRLWRPSWLVVVLMSRVMARCIHPRAALAWAWPPRLPLMTPVVLRLTRAPTLQH